MASTPGTMTFAGSEYHIKGTNLESAQEMNRSLVIHLLRQVKVCSRAELSKSTGLKQATITNIINDLINADLVRVTGSIIGAKGRRSIGISLNLEVYKVVGIRLSRKYISIGLFDIDGNKYSSEIVPTDMKLGSDVVLERIKEEVAKLIENINRSNILGIGIAIPGPFIKNKGNITLMAEFPGWENISIQDELESEFGLPTYLEHNANLGALAEWWLGGHTKQMGTMVYVTAGLGIGAGVIVDGKIFKGALGIAGEIGHMSISFDGPKCECGNSGCLEKYCSAIALVRDVKEELKNYPNSILQQDASLAGILEGLKANDELAKKAIKKSSWFLGFGLASILVVENVMKKPSLIVEANKPIYQKVII